MNLQAQIEELYAREAKEFGEEYFRAFEELKVARNEGRVPTGFQPAIGLRGSTIRVILKV